MYKLVLVSLAAGSLVACSGPTHNNGEHTHDGGGSNNGHGSNNGAATNNEGGTDTYADGMTKPGQMGLFEVTLVSASPAPPDVGDNSWTLRVTEAGADAPIDDAEVTVSPFMPAHGHGTSPADNPAAFTSDGTYEVGPFDLFMPGVWETTVHVASDAGEDIVVFVFELEG